MARRKKPSRLGFLCWLTKDGKRHFLTAEGRYSTNKTKAAVVRGSTAVDVSRHRNVKCAPATDARVVAMLSGASRRRRR